MVSVSVIIPVYNVEKYLQRCLDSVFNQTFSDLEIICVNDGSPDNSLAILQENAKKDKRIKIISQSNQGLSQARNNAMKHVSGKYVVFLDSDDFYDDNFIECLYKKAEEENADVVMTNTRYVSPDRSKQTCFQEKLLSSFDDKIKAIPDGSCWNKLYSSAFLKKHNLSFPSGLYFEDNLFTIPACYFADKFMVINGGCYNYIYNPNSITKDPKKEQKRLADGLAITKKLMEFCHNHKINEQDRLCVADFCLHNIINHKMLVDKAYYNNLISIIGKNKLLKKLYCKAWKKNIRRKIKSFLKNLLGIKTKKSA